MLELEESEIYLNVFEQLQRNAYHEGLRLGVVENCCKVYRRAKAIRDEKLMSLLDQDVIEEMERFYNRYGKLSDSKIAKHLIKESEYLIGFQA